jgi:hypothetical protein
MYRWRLRHKISACRGQVCGGMLGAMSRIATPQPHEDIARFAPRFLSAAAQRQTTQLCWSPATNEYLRLDLLSGGSRPGSHQSPKSTILRSAQQRFLLDPSCGAAAFEVNSDPHTGARTSVRLCVGF